MRPETDLDGVAEGRGLEDTETVLTRPVAAITCPRHDGLGEPEPLRLAQPAIQARHPAQLAEQPDLADHDGPGDHGPVAQGRGEGEGDGQVEAGLADREPTGEVGVDVMTAEADPRTTAEHGDEQPESVRIEAARLPGRRAVARRSDERLD